MLKQIILSIGILRLALGVRAAENPWEILADRDLETVHQLVQDNHPGPVDERNPTYAHALEEGLKAAKERAKAAQNFADYKRALLSYTNAFRDGHLSVRMLVDTTSVEWPGFLPTIDAAGRVTVGWSEVPEVKVGEHITSCDGQPLSKIFDTWVAPYYWNADLPQTRALEMPRTLLIDERDESRRVKSCEIERGGATRQVKLEWRSVPRARAPELRLHAAGIFIPPLGLRKVVGLWFLSLPNFWYPDSQSVARFKGVISDVENHKSELRNAPKIVIDLRGNTGGMSSWGEAMATALWGKDFVEPISTSFDNSVEWRASPANLAHIEDLLARAKRDGLTSAVTDLTRVRDALSAALAKGEPLAREDDPGHPIELPATSPMKAHVYVLTDSICESACLDFMDVMLRLPGVVHIGQPTSADALYIDTNEALLPSGLARLSYSMKVFRKRVRGNNEWYDPKIHWPGGAMTDEAVAKWIATLP